MMDQLKVLLVEDVKDEQETFKSSVDVFNHKHKDSLFVDCKIAENIDDAMREIDGSFDGAILDLKLGEEDDGGNKILDKIDISLIRIPVIFVTGFPDLVNDHPIIIRKRARADGEYETDFELLRDIKSTGLTHIMGGRGLIEKTLNEVFLKNLLPHLEAWKVYGKSDPSRTEKALLRFTLNHLMQLLDDDEDKCFPEEVYIYPPLSEGLKTGSILKEKEGGNYYVILNPTCDLVIRKGGLINTDRILLVKIDEEQNVYGHILKNKEENEQKREIIQTILSNRRTLYHHWLPITTFFPGGFINFRKLSTFSKKDCVKKFGKPDIQISPHFVKDILSRFSSYYARQGQPDIERNKIIEDIIASSGGA